MSGTCESGERETIAVAGASGFVGNALGRTLGERYDLVGLSRSRREAGGGYARFEPVDLFSLRDATRALAGASRAIYLVHSMLPSARLMQGHFGDMDLLCADNFARAAAANGVREILYVGGLVPTDPKLSDHLRSRLEVEEALAATGVPVRTLRAGIIVGAAGSSYQVVRRLASRLPVMLCPSWTGTRMQPVALTDVTAAIEHLLETPGAAGATFDLGAPEAVTYREMMAATARSMGLRRLMVPVPFLTPRLSALWVTMTTGAPRALIAPLVESLTHEMTVREESRLVIPGHPPTGLDEMLETASREMEDREATRQSVAAAPRAFQRSTAIRDQSEVRSVERMVLPEGADAAWAAREYLRWLPIGLRGLVSVREGNSPDEVEFLARGLGSPLLLLRYEAGRSTPDRQIFSVNGGLLSRRAGRGILEFRRLPASRTLLASVHEFEPRLPWWIYRNSQAVFHVMVMRRFAAHLVDCPEVSPAQSPESLPLVSR